ncbi:potassium voltage-gated channel subfamily KQT member 1-like [Clytia hemisphaerica]|uniref:Uncharacterized protein n=2 Tax=Clytia hemisphaerica TaxID=252671 RepID=A0A7M5XAE7_9CNID
MKARNINTVTVYKNKMAAQTLLYNKQPTFTTINPGYGDGHDEKKKIKREVAYFDFQTQLIQKAELAKKLRMKVFRFLEADKCHSKGGIYDKLLIVVILVSLALGIGSTIPGYDNGWLFKVRLSVETLLLVIFLTEYLLRVWSSGAHGTYGAAGGWKKYIITPHMIIDLLVILSSLGLVISTSLNLDPEERRLLYLLQLLRILRIDRQRGAFGAFWRVFKKHRKELLTCWYMGFLMVTFVSFLVYSLEQKRTNDTYTLNNLFDGVYWGVISLTTIGYGDIKPETTSGKILICCFAVFGTCFLAMPAGIIGSGFALQVAEQQKEKHVNRRRRPAAVLIQSFWRKYAADNDFPATWIPHTTQHKDYESNLLRTPRKSINHQRSSKPDMFGVPFTPIIPSIHVTRNENGKGMSSPPSKSSHPVSPAEIPDDFNFPNGYLIPAKKLTTAEKIALRFIRFLKCISSMKKFRQARRPYDERDILDQFASAQIEMFAKLRDVKQRIESCQICSDSKAEKNLNYISKLNDKVGSLHSEISETKELLKILLVQQGIDINKALNNKQQHQDND